MNAVSSRSRPGAPRARWGVLALVSVVFAYGWVMQGVSGDPQGSQYALVRALASGTPVVDETRYEVGELGTHDVRYRDGHYYSNKAPGLAFLTVGPFLVLDSLGALPVDQPSRALWALGLFGVVLPAGLLLLLVRWAAERVAQGCGTLTAVTLGLGTLLLPYATLFYSHVLAALLAFGAFAVLWAERSGRARPVLLAAGGLLAGYSVTTEYANALVVLVLGLYATARTRPVRRALVYAAGALAGVTPLVLYNAWAFGSIGANSYGGSYRPTGREPKPAYELVGRPWPSLRTLLETLFSTTGILVLAPVLAGAVAGTLVLWRRGRRAEASAVVGMTGLFLLYVSSYGSAFGGYGPGQRYLIPILPFLAFALAPLVRVAPATVLALALVSVSISASITSTHALAGYDGKWFTRMAEGQFTPTVASFVGITGWYTILPFFFAVGTATIAAAVVTPFRHTSRDHALAGTAVLAWALLATAAPRPAALLGGDADEWRAYWALAAVLAAALAAAVPVAWRRLAGGRWPRLADDHVMRRSASS